MFAAPKVAKVTHTQTWDMSFVTRIFMVLDFKPKEVLTKASFLVQSSPSLLEQYIGLCPITMIQGLLALFSGLFAS